MSSIGDDMDLPIPRILIILPNKGVDPTSVAKPWKALRDQGYTVEFATEYGQVAKAEQRFLERSWFRQAMGRSKWEIDLFYEMVGTDEYLAPHAWGQPGFSVQPYDAVIFPGVFNKTISQYTDSKTLQNLVRSYFPLTKRLRVAPPRARTFDLRFKRKSTASDEDFLPQEVLKLHEDGLKNHQGPRKVIGAIGRGVLVLAGAKCDPSSLKDLQQSSTSSSNRSTTSAPEIEEASRSTSSGAGAEEKSEPLEGNEGNVTRVVEVQPAAAPSAPAASEEGTTKEASQATPEATATIDQPPRRKLIRRRSSNLVNTKRLSFNGLTQKVLKRSATVSAAELRKNQAPENTEAPIPRSLSIIEEKKKARPCSDPEAKPRPSLSRKSFGYKRRSMPTGPVSVLYNVETTSVPTWMESVGTTLALAYGIRGMYKSFGPKKTTQADVTKELEGPHLFYSGPKTLAPFAHVDPKHHYVSARYPGDAELFASKLIEEIQLARKEWGKQVVKPQPEAEASASSAPSAP